MQFYNSQLLFSRSTGQMGMSGDCCVTCCRRCAQNLATRQIQVEFTGAFTGSYHPTFSGNTYILDWARDCVWELPLVGMGPIKRIRSEMGGVWNVAFMVDTGTGEFGDVIFSDSSASLANCMAISSSWLLLKTGFLTQGTHGTAECFISAVLPP